MEKNLTPEIHFKKTYYDSQRMIVCCDGQTLFDETLATDDLTISFDIPAPYSHGGML